MNEPTRAFKCKHCGHEIGRQEGGALRVGGARYTKSQRFPCGKCTRATLWSVTRATNKLHSPDKSVLH